MKKCPACGKPNKPVATVCAACGAELDNSVKDFDADQGALDATNTLGAPQAPQAPGAPKDPRVPTAPKPPALQ
ncbi:MAG: zinc ribbon domain-containing protein [Gordonibacter sp.]